MNKRPISLCWEAEGNVAKLRYLLLIFKTTKINIWSLAEASLAHTSSIMIL